MHDNDVNLHGQDSKQDSTITFWSEADLEDEVKMMKSR